MSRIHEALKRAEQERANAPQPNLGSATADQTESSPSPISSVPVAVAEAPVLEPSRIPADESEPLTIQTLLTRCVQAPWHQSSGKLLFQDSANQSRGTEEFRTLRSRLYQMREKQPLRTILITSCLPAEGKSFVATNLAQVIARQHERRALLIDSDLRMPRIHTMVGTPETPGLSDYLLGQADEFAITQVGQGENLFFIPGGKKVQNPVDLLGNGKMAHLLKNMAPLFDWIILDSPPATLVSDASILADLCDGVLFVAQSAATPFDAAQKVRQEFKDKNMIGVVLNRIQHGYGESSYYDSYYHTYGKTGSKNSKGGG
jgi:protein-tyrosine kinase